ncbi:MAG: hypothetical protein R3C01_16605 [Planctomycetaceae bacterium]
MRMKNFSLASKLFLLAGLPIVMTLVAAELSAQVRQFPYEAVVMAESVDVWSGPGVKYYATGRLKAHDAVTVHRHDPGGWFMISPPPGSFSWIDATLVQTAGDGTGSVNVPPDEEGRPARAIVRIGSTLSDAHSYYGRELSTGDTVQILGEKTLNTDRGPVRMYQITPPPLEYRWVKGDYIVPRDEALRQQLSRDPYAVPVDVLARQQRAAADPFTATQPGSNGTTASIATVNEPTNETPSQRMQQIDGRYTAMMRQAPGNWDIDSLVDEYSDLLPAAPPEVANEILQRLNALETRRAIQSDYIALTGHTVSDNRSTLAAPSFVQQQESSNPTLIASQPDPARQIPVPPVQQSPVVAPTPQRAVSGNDAAGGAESATPASIAPRLNGAGIVRVTSPPRAGVPAYSLFAPDGRFLTYLHPGDGINLQTSIGQSVGVIGSRSYDPRVQAEVVIVRQVLPVQLTP